MRLAPAAGEGIQKLEFTQPLGGKFALLSTLCFSCYGTSKVTEFAHEFSVHPVEPQKNITTLSLLHFLASVMCLSVPVSHPSRFGLVKTGQMRGEELC